MSDIQIIVMEGNYNNSEAYNCVLGYIAQKAYLGGYGFRCTPELSIIDQFEISKNLSNHSGFRKIWHFIITFQKSWDHTYLLGIGVQAAKLFSSDYQVLFALDLEGAEPHLHFGVNAYSYYPNTPILSEEIMDNYLKQIQNLLSEQYPDMTVTLLYK